MLMPNRHGQADSYRYGFQGQEKDDEVKGEGNSVNYKFRMHDPRVGRFFAVDPLTPQYPHYSPYSFSGNKVIAYRELEGLEEKHFVYFLDTNKKTTAILPLYEKQLIEYTYEKNGQPTISARNSQLVKHVDESEKFVLHFAYTKEFRGDYIDWDLDRNEVYQSYDAMVNDSELGSKLLEKAEQAALADKLNFLVSMNGFISSKRNSFRAGKIKSPCGCFIEGTKVLTDEGTKSIEDVKVGDLVWAYNDKTGDKKLKRVTRTFIKVRDHIYKIFFEKGIVEATDDHPFYVNGHWVTVENLKKGDLLNLYDGTKLPIKDIKYVKGVFEVFNFEVEDYHSYYVSNKSILVHNSNPCASKIHNGLLSKITKGKWKDPGYHAHFDDGVTLDVINNYDAVYLSTAKKGNLIYRKGDNIVVVGGSGTQKNKVITGYGPKGIKGESGRKALGGNANDPGDPITHEMIIKGEIPNGRGGNIAPAYPVDVNK